MRIAFLTMVILPCTLLLASCDEGQVVMLVEEAIKDGQSHHPSPNPTVTISWTSNSFFKAYLNEGVTLDEEPHEAFSD